MANDSVMRDLILKNRSFRRWHQDEAIEYDTLKEFVDLARLCSSACNQQALKYVISNEPEKNALIYSFLAIDNNPVEGEQAAAYIIILEDKGIKMIMPCDFGITAQTIMLAAVEQGLGGVMIGAIVSEVIGLFLNEGSVAEQLFVRYISFGPKVNEWNLVILEVTFGFQIRFNLMSVIGVFVASQMLRWYR